MILTYVLVPFLAPKFGREKLITSQKIQPASVITILLNRNYVKPEINKILEQTIENLEKTPIKILYLDACFPFLDGFPLFPHLSHNDGKKLDLSFVYVTADGAFANKVKSVSGYGVFEEARLGELDQNSYCLRKGNNFYDFPKYLTFGQINHHLKFSEQGTKQLILALLNQPEIDKILIEPYLKQRLNLFDGRIRFQGCHSVRHDDHIHIQIK